MSAASLANAFNPNTVAFNAGNMSYLAWCATLTYEQPEVIKQALEAQQLRCEKDFFFASETTGTEGFIVGDEEKIILAFRGTELDKTIDWLTNANALKTEFGFGNKTIGYVHRGFYDAFLSVWGMILPQLYRLRDNQQSLWVTGHSLGGALATLAVATLSFEDLGLPVHGMYTFGQPRVGDSEFAEAFNLRIGTRCFRIVYAKDIVSFVPSNILGFRHVGTLKHSDSSYKLVTKIEDDWKEVDMDIAQYFRLASIADHSMNKYQEFALFLLQQGNALAQTKLQE